MIWPSSDQGRPAGGVLRRRFIRNPQKMAGIGEIVKISDSFAPLVNNEALYLLLYGGAGSGKSEFVARKIWLRCRIEGGHRFLIMRKVRARCRESVIEVFKSIAAEEGVGYFWNDSRRTMQFPSIYGINNEILFDGLDDPLKIKSIKGITGMWLEEMTEFTEKDFAQLDLRLRGETPSYKQIIGSFNPDEAVGMWIKEMFFKDLSDGHTGTGSFDGSYVHHSTINDNPMEDERNIYRQKLERYDDKTLRSIYLMGHWAAVKGLIYPDWKIEPLPVDGVKDPNWFDDIWLGLDFGYTINQTAVVKIYKKGRKLWFEEILYMAGLTNRDIANKLKSDPRVTGSNEPVEEVEIPVYCDSAEPKSIDELYTEGINAKPALKGRDSVAAGIQFLHGFDCIIVNGSTHIIGERKTYKWAEDKLGNLLNEPVKVNNHAMDGIRYGGYTHLFGQKKPYFGVSDGPMY